MILYYTRIVFLLLITSHFSISSLGNIYDSIPRTKEMLLIQKEHFEWFVEQQAENDICQKRLIAKDSSINDLKQALTIDKKIIDSYKRDSVRSDTITSALRTKSTLYKDAYTTQTKALTKMTFKKNVLEGLGAVLILVLAWVEVKQSLP